MSGRGAGPSGGLAPFVSRVVSYDAIGAAGIHRGLPSTGLTLVLPIDDPIDVSWTASPDHRPGAAGAQGHLIGWSLVSGLHTQPARIHHGPRQRGVQITLTVGGARALFGVPASALRDELVDLADLVPALAELPEQLHHDATWEQREQRIASVLLAEFTRRETPASRGEVGRALARLTRGASVTDVADEVGYSRRRLSTLVRDETGVTPKQWARLARFEQAKDALTANPTARLADVAARFGYSDHAHLTRDWVDLAGCAPTVWLAEEFPNLQAPRPEAVDTEAITDEPPSNEETSP